MTHCLGTSRRFIYVKLARYPQLQTSLLADAVEPKLVDKAGAARVTGLKLTTLLSTREPCGPHTAAGRYAHSRPLHHVPSEKVRRYTGLDLLADLASATPPELFPSAARVTEVQRTRNGPAYDAAEAFRSTHAAFWTGICPTSPGS